VAALIDTNILVYRFDSRFPEKQRTANHLLREGLRNESIRIPHQALVEFVSVVSRIRPSGVPMLASSDAHREAEELLSQFPILYPNASLFRTALRGMAAYGISWFDAHMWAYAEHYGLRELLSEDFEHGRIYGTVRVMNPFLSRS
jgi:predicted nucleic acid-binding protein